MNYKLNKFSIPEIDNLYKMLMSTMDSRKDLFSKFNGDYLNKIIYLQKMTQN